ncbi:MAG TPA: hypothetical protein VGO93_29640 [Candidatus Xenobia bacterium]
MKQTELEQLYRVLAMYSQAGGSPPKDAELMSLESNLRDMNQKYGDAVAEISRLQQHVGMLQKIPGAGNGTAIADPEELAKAQDELHRLQADLDRERERTRDANELAAQWQAAAEEAAADAGVARKQDLSVDTGGLENRIKQLEAALEEKDKTHHAALEAASEAEKHARSRVAQLEEAAEELKSHPDESGNVAELEKRIEELHAELARREHDKAALTDTFGQVEEAARQRIGALEDELKRRTILHQEAEPDSGADERLEQAEARIRTLEAELKKKAAEADKLPSVRVAAAEAEKRARDAEHRARDAQEKLEHALADAGAAGRADDLQGELHARDQRIEELEQHLEAHKKSAEEQHGEVHERVARLSEERDEAAREREEHRQRLADMEERLASQDRVRQRLEDDLEAQDEAWQQKLAGLEESHANLTQEVEGLGAVRQELEQHHTVRAEMEAELSHLKSSRQSLADELEALRAADASKAAAHQELETVRRELEEARHQHATRVEALETDHRTLQADHKTLAETAAAEKASLEAAVKDLEESLDDTVKDYDNRIAEQTEENEQALDELQQALHDQEEAHHQAVAQFEARLAAQEKAHQEALDKHGAVSDESQALRAELTTLKQALEAKTEALEEAQAEVDALQSDTEMLNAQFKGRIDMLEKERASRSDEFTTAQTKATALQSEVARLTTQAEQALAQVAKLERQLNEQAANPDDAKRFAEMEEDARGLRERLLEAEQGSDKVVQERDDLLRRLRERDELVRQLQNGEPGSGELKRRVEEQEADIERLTLERDELRDEARKEREALKRRVDEQDAELKSLALERDSHREQAAHASPIDEGLQALVEELERDLARVTHERNEMILQAPLTAGDEAALRQELDAAHAALIVERERREEAETRIEELKTAAQQVSENLERGTGWPPAPAPVPAPTLGRARTSSAGVTLVPAGMPDGVTFLLRNILSRTHAAADDMLELGRRWARLHPGTLKEVLREFEAEGLGTIQMIGWNSEQNAFELQCRELLIFNANYLTGLMDESLLRLTGQGCTYHQSTSLTDQPTVTIYVRTSEGARAAVEQVLMEAKT